MAFANVRNEINFFLRQKFLGKLRLRPGTPQIKPSHREQKEWSFYELAIFKALSAEQTHSYSHVIDVGSRNWSYLPALLKALPKAQFSGIEVDALRRYWYFYRRIDVARAYIQFANQKGRKAEYFPIDFLNFKLPLKEQRVLFTFFFPFVFSSPCLSWGLPTRFVNFSKLLLHSKTIIQDPNSLPIETTWLSLHQGEWEATEAKKAYDQAKIPVKLFVLKAQETHLVWPSPYDTYVFCSKFI